MARTNMNLPDDIDRQMRHEAIDLGLRYPGEFIQHLWENYKKEAKAVKYEVIVKQDGIEVISYPNLSEDEAVQLAREEAKSNKECQVFVRWFRPSDGQHGYLNPDGSHAITGKAW